MNEEEHTGGLIGPDDGASVPVMLDRARWTRRLPGESWADAMNRLTANGPGVIQGEPTPEDVTATEPTQEAVADPKKENA